MNTTYFPFTRNLSPTLRAGTVSKAIGSFVLPRNELRIVGQDMGPSADFASVMQTTELSYGPEWDRPPPVTLIETVTVPVGTDSVAVKETLTVKVGLHGLFVKYAVTPSGRSEAVMVTGTAEPVVRVAVIEDEGLVSPRTKEIEPGDGEERLKSKLGCSTAEITLTSSAPEGFNPRETGHADVRNHQAKLLRA